MRHSSMNLYIAYGDLHAVFRSLKHQWEIGCDVLLARQDGFLKDGRLECVMGGISNDRFSCHCAGLYNVFSMRGLYDMIVLLKNHKVPEKDILWMDESYTSINIGAMVALQERLRTEQLIEENRLKLKPVKENVAVLLTELKTDGLRVQGMEYYIKRNIRKNKQTFSYTGFGLYKGRKIRYRLFFERINDKWVYWLERLIPDGSVTRVECITQ